MEYREKNRFDRLFRTFRGENIFEKEEEESQKHFWKSTKEQSKVASASPYDGAFEGRQGRGERGGERSENWNRNRNQRFHAVDA